MSSRRTPHARRRVGARGHLGASDEAVRGNALVLLGLVVLGLLALVAYLSTVAISGGPLERPYLVSVQVPRDAPALKDGDEVRIAGQRAGEVREVEVDRATAAAGEGPRLTLALDDGPVTDAATVRVRLRGLAGAVYLDLDPGRGRSLDSPATLRAGAGSASTDLADVVEAFDADTRAALRRTLRGYGSGLSGRGEDLGATIAELGPAAERVTPLARAMRPAPGVLAGLLGDLRTTVRAFDADGALARTVGPARRTLDALPAPAVERTLTALPRVEATAAAVLPVADRLLDDTTAATAELRPAVASLRRALPALRGALARDRALDELARVGRAARPVLRAARPLVRELRVPAALLTPLADPLGPLSRYLIPYEREIVLAPDGFTRWGGFRYAEGQASGSRAVRFSMILTCHRARDGYPAPGAAMEQEQRCAR